MDSREQQSESPKRSGEPLPWRKPYRQRVLLHRFVWSPDSAQGQHVREPRSRLQILSQGIVALLAVALVAGLIIVVYLVGLAVVLVLSAVVAISAICFAIRNAWRTARPHT